MIKHPVFFAVLLLRLSLGALFLSLASLTLTALYLPAFAADLAAQGMPAPLSWPALLVELAAGVLLVLGVHGRGASRGRAAVARTA